jgi:hypothetical protein
VDNQKSAVIEHRIGGQVRFNPRFLDFAGHYGFVPKACRPYRARTKGKTERMVGYVKHHFFVRYRSFESLAHLNQALQAWLAEEADSRVHGTHGEGVMERFARERAALSALPALAFDTSYRERRFVAWDGYIDVRGNRYSVPARLCGQAVVVRISLDGVLKVYDVTGQWVAEHRLTPVGDGWQRVPVHHTNLWSEALAVQRRELTRIDAAAQWN